MTRDLRRYSRQTNFRLLLGFLLLVFLLGDGLIYLFMGRNAAIMGLVCLTLGLAPARAGVAAAGLLMGWLVKKERER